MEETNRGNRNHESRETTVWTEKQASDLQRYRWQDQ
jgi:hypothetical protein